MDYLHVPYHSQKNNFIYYIFRVFINFNTLKKVKSETISSRVDYHQEGIGKYNLAENWQVTNKCHLSAAIIYNYLVIYYLVSYLLFIYKRLIVIIISNEI